MSAKAAPAKVAERAARCSDCGDHPALYCQECAEGQCGELHVEVDEEWAPVDEEACYDAGFLRALDLVRLQSRDAALQGLVVGLRLAGPNPLTRSLDLEGARR